MIEAPVGTLVEEIDGTRLVHANVSIGDELLILLHSHYPDRLLLTPILTSLSGRSEGGVKNELRSLREKKLVHGDNKVGYRLTTPGHVAAARVIQREIVAVA